jgi:hypothetical protein
VSRQCVRLEVVGIDLGRLISAVGAAKTFLFSISACPSLGERAGRLGLSSGIADGINNRALVDRTFFGRRSTHLYEPDGHGYTSVEHGDAWVSFGSVDPRIGPLSFWLITKRIAAEHATPRPLSIPNAAGFAFCWLPPWRLRGFRGRNPVFWRPFLQYGWQDDERGEIERVALRWTWLPHQRKGRWLITQLDHSPITFVLPARPAETEVRHRCKDWDPGARIPPELQDRLIRLSTHARS